MKNVVILAVILMLFGCVTPQVPETNETVENITNVTVTEPPAIEEEKVVETFAIESVDGIFRHTDYAFSDNSNPFSDGAGGDLGKTSTAYIKVNEEDLGFLSSVCDDEKQAFWFNLRTKDEKGVIFEAVYSVDFAEDCETVKFLGRGYEIEVVDKPESTGNRIVRGGTIKLTGEDSIITLRDGSGFNRDDRWPVVLGWKDGKLVKIIVYMGGYFYDMESDTSVVPLFGSGNQVLARFTNMKTSPAFELITTDMTMVNTASGTNESETAAKQEFSVNYSFSVQDSYMRTSYEGYESINGSGVYLTFEPAIPIYVSEFGNYPTEQHGLMIPILDKEYALSCLKFDNGTNSSRLCLADEEKRVRLSPHGCGGEGALQDDINVSGKRFGLMDFVFGPDEYKAILCEILGNGTCANEFYMYVGENRQIPDDGMLHLWTIAPGYTFCAKWIELSHFNEEIMLEDGVDGVELVWENETVNPALKSIFIPANSPAYEKLVGSG